MQGADLEFDRRGCLVIFRPRLAEDEGKQNGEDDAKLEEDGGANLVMLPPQLGGDGFLHEKRHAGRTKTRRQDNENS